MSRNMYAVWNKSPSSAERSQDPAHAANRILAGYFAPQLIKGDLALKKGQGIFTMGSCFAREIEHALRKRGFPIDSMDIPYLESGDFKGEDGKVSVGFFHRYNVPSMEQELRQAVGDMEFAEDRHLLVATGGGKVHDLNYGLTLPRLSLEGAVERRRMVRDMVARFRHSSVIVITLGLSEAWYHKPSELYCNAVAGDVLARQRKDFEFREVSYEQNLASLRAIVACLRRHHATGRYRLIVTVSPVPLQSTFGEDDIVLANFRAKATLRATADAICREAEEAIYFPSYEIAMFSDPALVWRPDMVHIQPQCVAHITETFINRFVV